MVAYTHAIFQPEPDANYWEIFYYCCYSESEVIAPSESVWIVPGTLEI